MFDALPVMHLNQHQNTPAQWPGCFSSGGLNVSTRSFQIYIKATEMISCPVWRCIFRTRCFHQARMSFSGSRQSGDPGLELRGSGHNGGYQSGSDGGRSDDDRTGCDRSGGVQSGGQIHGVRENHRTGGTHDRLGSRPFQPWRRLPALQLRRGPPGSWRWRLMFGLRCQSKRRELRLRRL